mgnify:CR=1 FL=1
MATAYTWPFRLRLAIERRRLRLSEWAYRWRHWSDANLPLDDPTPPTPTEGDHSWPASP